MDFKKIRVLLDEFPTSLDFHERICVVTGGAIPVPGLPDCQVTAS